jgi:MFS family permease
MGVERTPRRAWLVWALGLAAYAAAVFQRASLGVAGVEAQHRFGASAAILSLFAVLQLGVYAGLQVPVGVLLDRLGSRRLVVAGGVTMAAGQLVLATTHSVGLAVLGRVLVGAGDAMTFISVLRLVALWFAPHQVPVLTQLTGMLGQLGQIAAAFPLVALLEGAGWTPAFLGAGIVGLGIAGTAAAALRDTPPGVVPAGPPPGVRDAIANLRHAWREPGTRLGLWTHFVTQFSGAVFGLLWGYPFLVVGEGRSPGEAGALLTLLVVVAMGVGPVVGHLAGRWPYRRSVPVQAIVLGSAGAWTLVLLWPGRAPLVLLVLLAVVLATNGPGSMMGFDYARTENDPERIGSATGIVNVGGFVASLCTIAAVGIILDLRGAGSPTDATLADFKVAMCFQYLVWAVGLIGVLRTRRVVRAVRGIALDPFPQAVVRVSRERRARRT